MFKDTGTTVVRKPVSFLSIAALGISSVLITAIVSVVGLAAYSVHVFDKKTSDLPTLIQETVEILPELRASLPPALADTLDDVRRPEYRDSLKITVKQTAKADRWGGRKVGVVVENQGDEMISLLSMRVVGTDEEGTPVTEKNICAATPLQIDNDWRGPLMPRETRRLVVYCHDAEEAAEFTSEITEVRVWQRDKTEKAQSKPASAKGKTDDDAQVDEDA
ncbi:MAG TPA: hypothetical protein VJZ71_02245 [Phycisphaerae bacterium]|nr:hypothetical protein [Phycisphaerae bacterium]